jgi:phosphate starvation-inducible protein PhoH
MNNYEKCEYIHSQLLEIIDKTCIDIDTMIEYIEDIREYYFEEEDQVSQPDHLSMINEYEWKEWLNI